jgi:hypothetical protein
VGTQGSGKTTTSKLIEKYILEKEKNAKIIRVDSWPRANQNPMACFLIFRFPGLWTTSDPNTVLIVDDAHHSFYDQFSWAQFTHIRDNENTSRVILFSSYGNPVRHKSPWEYWKQDTFPIQVSPEQRITLRPKETIDGSSPVGLLLTKSELPFVIERQFKGNHFDDTLIEWAFEISAGLVGALIQILKLAESQDVRVNQSSVSSMLINLL